MEDDNQLIVSTHHDGHRQRQVPSIFDLSAASAADSKATSPEDLLHSWNSVHSAIRSLDSKLAKRLLREWQELKIEDVNLGGLSLDILKRMKPSELDKLMQGKTIAHIGDVVPFMQQLLLVYSDYGSCVPAMEAVEEALTQNFGIQPSRTTVERAKLTVPDSATSEKHLVFRNKLRALMAMAAKKAMAPTTSAKPADRSTLPQNEQYDDYERVQVFSDETKEKIEGDDLRFMVVEWDPKKSAYVVYDREAKSTRSAKPQFLRPVLAATTEMVPDLVADQLDLDQIQAHMLSGSTLLWKPINWEASKLVFAQTRRFLVDEDLRRAADSFGGNCIHKSMTLLLEKSGVSQGAELITSIGSAPIVWTGSVYDLVGQIRERRRVLSVLEQAGGASTLVACELVQLHAASSIKSMRPTSIRELLERCFMVFRREMLDRKSRLTHEQLVNELEHELLRIHRDEVAADAINVHRPYDNTPAPRSAKAATRPAARPAQDSAAHAEPEACRNFQMGKCMRGDDCRYAHTGAPAKRVVAATAPAKPVPNNPIACSHEVVKPGSCPRKTACRFSHDRAVVAKDRKDKAKLTAHKGRVSAYNARGASVAVPDSTAEEGDDEQRAACSATRTPVPTTGLGAGSRFVLSFSDSDDDAPAGRAASSAHRQLPCSDDDDSSSSTCSVGSAQEGATPNGALVCATIDDSGAFHTVFVNDSGAVRSDVWDSNFAEYSSTQEGATTNGALACEIVDDSGAVLFDFIHLSPDVTRALTARDVPIIGQLADASSAPEPCYGTCTLSIPDVVSRTSHTESTKGGDPSKVDKDGASATTNNLALLVHHIAHE